MPVKPPKYFSVAPMMNWTDKHCRFFHRQLSQKAILYTEMITADAIIHGDRQALLAYDPCEHPVICQLGGSDAHSLKQATKIVADFGYDEINLNVGCPSDRVQSGTFGACLMKNPDTVAALFSAMSEATSRTVSIKCRIGIDDDVPWETLPRFIETVHKAGCHKFIIHARKAWLSGLSPKENRDVPPLDYELVYAIKNSFPKLHIGINGGINQMDAALKHLEYVDEVMLGRSAYHQPDILTEVDHKIYGLDYQAPNYQMILEEMMRYCQKYHSLGGNLYHILRHILGLFHGQAGARKWRQYLTEEGVKKNASADVIAQAFEHIKHFA